MAFDLSSLSGMGGGGGGGGMFGGANLGGSLGAYLGSRKQRKEAKRGKKYMKEQYERSRTGIEDQLAALFGEEGSIGTLYGGAREDITGGTNQAIASLLGGYAQAGDVARAGMGEAIGRLDPYSQQGGQAFDLYNRALMGGEGAADAFSTFREGTGYNFLQDEMARATQRQFAGQGKAGSGNVLAALQERSAGLASQSFNDYMSQLMGSAQMGQQAATTQAGMQQGLTQYLAGLETAGGENVANLQRGLGAELADLGVSQAALESQIRSGVIGGEYNLAGNALGQVGQFYGLTGAAQAQEMTAAGEHAHEVAKFIGSMVTMSDMRLKENIEFHEEIGGIGVYSFDPTEEGAALGMDYNVGVMAQEVQEVYPEHVINKNGFLAVDYVGLNESMGGTLFPTITKHSGERPHGS